MPPGSPMHCWIWPLPGSSYCRQATAACRASFCNTYVCSAAFSGGWLKGGLTKLHCLDAVHWPVTACAA